MASIVNQAPLYLFSTEQIPYSNQKQAQIQWFGTDSEERYKKEPHPSLRPEDVLYQFNSHGYRCPEFVLDEGDKNIITVVSVGASEVFGTGLPEDKTFPHVFTKLLEEHLECSVINWNLGIGGSSSDCMSRILISALPVLKPDIVLLLFPFYGRREHINVESRVFAYSSHGAENKLKNRAMDPENFNQLQANLALSSDYNDQINFFKNYQVCEALCDKHKTMWLYSAYQMSFFNQIEHLISRGHLVSPGLGDLKLKYKDDPINGLARDMAHPGIQPHKEMAENFFEQLKSLYFDRMGFF